MKSTIWKLCAGVAVISGLAGCGSNGGGDSATNAASPDAAANAAAPVTAPPATGARSLKGAGATFPYPLYSKWFSEYNTAKGVQVDYQSIGSGGGIQQLKSGTVDFGASDAPLSDDAVKEMPSPIVQIPTVAGAIAVVYNVPGAPNNLKLTGEVLANIFLGKITKWNDAAIAGLNAGAKLPATAITIAHRADGSGTTNIFTGYLKAVSPAWGTTVGAGKAVKWPVGQGGKGNDGVASIVQQTPGGIGYVELAYAMQNKMSFAALKNKAGQFVTPSVAGTTAAATGALADIKKDVRAPIFNAPGAASYPIAGFTYILVYKKSQDAEKGKALVDLLTWAINDGQKMAGPLNYASLPAAVVKLDEAALKTIQ